MEILEQRAVAFGATDVEVRRENSSRVSVVLRGVVSEERARELLERTALLEFRKPVLSKEGLILCQARDGARFYTSADEIIYTPENPDGRLAPQCVDSEEKSGSIVWRTAEAVDDPGLTEDTTTTIQPVSASVDRTQTPAVVASFSREGSARLQQITTQLVGLPLGIFLDGELLAGPKIVEPVTTGRVVIADLTLPAAYILAAQLTAGPLPVSVKEISAMGVAR